MIADPPIHRSTDPAATAYPMIWGTQGKGTAEPQGAPPALTVASK